MMENNINSVKTKAGFKGMQSNALPLSYTHSVLKKKKKKERKDLLYTIKARLILIQTRLL